MLKHVAGFCIVILCLVQLNFAEASAPRTNAGRSFLAAFGRNFQSDDGKTTITIIVNSLDKPTSVRIRDAAGKTLDQYDLPARSSHTTVIPYEKYFADLSGQLTHIGLYIKSSRDVTAQIASLREYSSDATMLFPRRALGREYTVGTYTSQTQQGCFQVVASNSNTQVHANLRAAAMLDGAVVGPGLVSFTLPKRFDTVTLCSTAPDDLSGSSVKASKDIAVFGFHVCANVPTEVGACDNLLEQIAPDSALGLGTVIVPFASREAGDIVRVIALMNDTTVEVNGDIFATLGAGQVYEFTNPSRFYSLMITNHPVQFFQFAKGYDSDFHGDPFMTTVPSFPFWLREYTFSTLPGFTNYMSIAINSNPLPPILFLNGQPIVTSEQDWTGSGVDGEYAAKRFLLDNGTGGTYHVVSPGVDGKPFELQVYGFNSFNSYGFNAGQSFKPAPRCVDGPFFYCVPDPQA